MQSKFVKYELEFPQKHHVLGRSTLEHFEGPPDLGSALRKLHLHCVGEASVSGIFVYFRFMSVVSAGHRGRYSMVTPFGDHHVTRNPGDAPVTSGWWWWPRKCTKNRLTPPPGTDFVWIWRVFNKIDCIPTLLLLHSDVCICLIEKWCGLRRRALIFMTRPVSGQHGVST